MRHYSELVTILTLHVELMKSIHDINDKNVKWFDNFNYDIELQW